MANVEFDYDVAENILYVSYPPGTIWEAPENAVEVFELLRRQIEAIGCKVIVVVDLANIFIPLDPRLLDALSHGIKKIISDNYVYAYIRYNAQDITTATNLRVSSMRADVSSNIMFDRAAALRKARSLSEEWRATNPDRPYPEPLTKC